MTPLSSLKVSPCLPSCSPGLGLHYSGELVLSLRRQSSADGTSYNNTLVYSHIARLARLRVAFLLNTAASGLSCHAYSYITYASCLLSCMHWRLLGGAPPQCGSIDRQCYRAVLCWRYAVPSSVLDCMCSGQRTGEALHPREAKLIVRAVSRVARYMHIWSYAG